MNDVAADPTLALEFSEPPLRLEYGLDTRNRFASMGHNQRLAGPLCMLEHGNALGLESDMDRQLRRGADKIQDVPIFNEAQRRRLDEMRRRSNIDAARLSPEERLRRADELRRMAWLLRPGVASASDETVEIIGRWRRSIRGPT